MMSIKGNILVMIQKHVARVRELVIIIVYRSKIMHTCDCWTDLEWNRIQLVLLNG
jgi:hypothetical protein